MKKVISGALAAAIITSNLPLRVLAEENGNMQGSTDSGANQENSVERKGYIEVDINLDMPIKYSNFSEINVRLNKVDREKKSVEELKNVSLGESEVKSDYTVEALKSDRATEAKDKDKVYSYRVTFKNLSAGADKDYSVKISGVGFSEVVSDTVNLDKYSKRIVVNNLSKRNNNEKSEEGFIPFGDVDGNGKIDDKDYEKVFEKIGTEDFHYDLDRDDDIDIVDLQYVHNNLGKSAVKPVVKDAEWIPNLDNIKTNLAEGNSFGEGKIENIFDGDSESSVEIKPATDSKITETNNVNLSLDLNKESQEAEETSPITMQYLSILGNLESGTIVVTDENGALHNIDFGKSNSSENTDSPSENAKLIKDSTVAQNKNIVIDLGEQIAVTKITINVTGVSDDRNLAEIAKIEFLNDVYKEIPKPEMTVPKITGIKTSTSTGNEHIELSWSETLNITGYELKVEEINEEGKVKGSAKTFRMSENNFKISNVKPYSRYRLSVQSINGEWLGGYGTNKVKENVIENVDVNNNYKPLTEEKFKENGEDGVVNVMVIPNEVPKYPEGIKAEGNYKSINLSWKTHNSARSFDVYYREKGSNEDFIHANGKTKITGNSYNITGLKDDTTYEIKMTATNHLGEGGESPLVLATTIDMSIPKTPNYKLINTVSKDGTTKTDNIKDVIYPGIVIPEDKEHGKLESDNKYAVITNKYAVVDNDYKSYWAINDTDSGIADAKGNNGPRIEFDFTNKNVKEYKIDKIAVVSKLDGTGMTPDFAEVNIFNDKNDNNASISNGKTFVPKVINHTNNGVYTMLEFASPITVKEGNHIQVNMRSKSGNISITELKFYEYDDIEKEINSLFKDELYLELSTKATKEKITELKNRLNKQDNGEDHPDKKELEKKLIRAEQLLNDTNLNDKITEVDILINAGGTNTGYGNDWQALGLAAKAGETIKVYLSRDIADDAINRDVYLAYEQNYAESGTAISQPIKLNPGENTIKIEALNNYDKEKGGNLYVRMSGMPDNPGTKIRVRVSGAEKIPHLNLNNRLEDVDYLVNNKSNNSDEKVKPVKDALKAYIVELKDYVENIETLQAESNKKHEGDKNFENNIYDYDRKYSILNSTNIEGDRFTLTIPAEQVYNGLGLKINSSEEEINKRVDKMYDSMLAWEQLIQITNAKKGVFEKDNGSGLYANNKASRQRVNVKYQRMFGGAFMYAGGHHVGVEYDSTGDFMNGVPFKFNSEGKVTNPSTDPETGKQLDGGGYLFGWGISHEIGHKADIGKRTYGETSNNILALITQTFDGVSKSRLEMNSIYPKIYKKVTSNSVGASQDVATLLGMFWQLHLAYELGYTSQMLKNNTDSYYAKMNRLYRNLTDTEKKLDKDQLLIRKASDAAGKDLREFFASWGLIADENTIVYLQQRFNEDKRETRKIQYLNDEAYRRRLAGTADMAEGTEVKATFANNVKDGSIVQGSSVTLDLDVNQSGDKILGYEIIRNDGNKKGGENEGTIVNYRPVGFVNADENGEATFTDNISPMNNRAVTYKVVAYDYNLKPTAEVTVGSVKLSHDGTMSSEDFVLKSNMISTVGKSEGSNGESTVNENTTEDNSLDKIKDGNKSTVFRGRRMTSDEYTNNPHKQEGININEDPYIIMDLQGSKNISGLKYTKSNSAVSRFSLKRLFNRSTTYSPITNYEIYLSNDGETWGEAVSTGTFEFGNKSVLGGATDKDTAKVIFTKNSNLYAYDARYVKLVAKDAGNSNLDIADISLIGSTGDNIEIGAVNIEDNQISTGIGRLESDFVYDNKGNKIPAGSILVVGKYKGNPAFNVPLLIDENNHTIGGKALLMAQVKADAELGSVADGTWMYWISKENFDKLSTKVKAELYRYNEVGGDDGKTPIGQRLVSDTLYMNVSAENYDALPVITLKNQGNIDTENSRKKSKSSSSEMVMKYVNTNNFKYEEN